MNEIHSKQKPNEVRLQVLTGQKFVALNQKTMLLLLLSACFSVGISLDRTEEDYGSTHRMKVAISVHYIEFRPKGSSEQMVLWTRDAPEPSSDTRRVMSGNYYLINTMTQRDSGSYILIDKNRITLSTKTVEVVAKRQSHVLKSGDTFSIRFDLEPNSCNIYFIPRNSYKTAIVHQGTLQQPLDLSGCSRFKFSSPCGIWNEAVKTSCSGQFEVRDHNDDEAMLVSLEVEPHSSPFYTSYLLYGGCGIIVLFLSGCLKFFCVTKSSTEKNRSKLEASGDELAELPEFDHEPVGGRLNRPAERLYPAQPLTAPTSPLIHNPTVDPLPAYSEVSAPAEQLDHQTVLLCPNYEPRFELKGMTMDSLSSSDPAPSNVYSSDKLNFL